MENTEKDLASWDSLILGPPLAEQIQSELRLSSESDDQVLIGIAEEADRMQLILYRAQCGSFLLSEKEKVNISSKRGALLIHFYDLLQKRKSRQNSQSSIKMLSGALVDFRDVLRETPGIADDLINNIMDKTKVKIMERYTKDKKTPKT